MKINSKLIRNLIIGTFISVPILSSFISTIHIVSLFDLGNYSWMSILLAISFELGAVAAFLIPTILTNIKKGLIYSIFILLSLLQIIGNVFFSFSFIFNKLKIDPTWLDSFMAFVSNFGVFSQSEVTLWLAVIIGVPIPLVALFFLKSWVDYLNMNKIDKILETNEEVTKQEESVINNETIIDDDKEKEESEEKLILSDDSNDMIPELDDEHSRIPIIQNNNLK
jgi:ABC-type multidrug transport system fused ATPase/permease subunit